MIFGLNLRKDCHLKDRDIENWLLMMEGQNVTWILRFELNFFFCFWKEKGKERI